MSKNKLLKVWVSVELKTAQYQVFLERYLLINFIKYESRRMSFILITQINY